MSTSFDLKRKQASRERIAARVEQIRPCVQDGWALKEIYRTYGTSSRFVKRWFPDYTGMPAQESGSLSQAIQRRKSK